MRKVRMTGLLIAAAFATVVTAGCGDSTEEYFENYAKCGTVGEYVGVEYTPESREVTDDDIQSSIDSFCEENSTTEENTTRSVEADDVVNIDYVETVSGAEVDSQTDYTLSLGYDTLGTGFDDQLVGYKPGSEITILVEYDDDYEDTTLAGMTAEFDVTINYISVTTVPDYTDDLVNEATEGEYTTTDDYTAYLTEQLQESADSNADDADKQSVLQSVIDVSTFTEYPEDEVSTYVQNVMYNIESQCDSYGIDVETYIYYFYGYTSENDFLNYIKETVETVMQEKIVVSIIAMNENLIATDEDISAYKQDLADDYGIEVDELSSYYSDEDLMFYATEENVLEYILANAVQVEATEDADDAEDVEDTEETDDAADAEEE